MVLTSDYASHSDASGGPLRPGDVGEVVKDDKSGKKYQVHFVCRRSGPEECNCRHQWLAWGMLRDVL